MPNSEPPRFQQATFGTFKAIQRNDPLRSFSEPAGTQPAAGPRFTGSALPSSCVDPPVLWQSWLHVGNCSGGSSAAEWRSCSDWGRVRVRVCVCGGGDSGSSRVQLRGAAPRRPAHLRTTHTSTPDPHTLPSRHQGLKSTTWTSKTITSGCRETEEQTQLCTDTLNLTVFCPETQTTGLQRLIFRLYMT